MRCLVVTPHLGLDSAGNIQPGGLQSFGRTVIRALAASPHLTQLGIWSQVEQVVAAGQIEKIVQAHAQPSLEIKTRCFETNRVGLATSFLASMLRRHYDYVMYLHTNQAVLSVVPFQVPYTVWEIGTEVYVPLSSLRYRAIKNADTLLSISRKTSDVAITNNPGLPEATVIYPCLEPPVYGSISAGNPDAKLLGQIGHNFLLIVGRMSKYERYKGHDELIQAMPRLVKDYPPAKLVIAGKGDDMARLQELAHELQVHEHVVFTGFVSEATLSELYNRCRAFVMPSQNEGFGLVYLEAMRARKPCVALADTAPAEIIVDNRTGFLLDDHQPEQLATVLIRLLRDQNLAERMGNEGFEHWKQHFSYDVFKARLHTHLQDLIEVH